MNENNSANHVTILFLGVAFTIAAERLLKTENVFDWIAFTYFIFNNIRYLYGDLRWSEVEIEITQDMESLERVIQIHFYVITRFLVIALAYQIGSIENFFWIYALAQFTGALSIAFSLVCIYHQNKKNAQRTRLRKVQLSWLYFNIVELLIAILVAIILHSETDIIYSYPAWREVNFQGWTLFIGFGCLFLVMMSDWIKNKDFLFAKKEGK